MEVQNSEDIARKMERAKKSRMSRLLAKFGLGSYARLNSELAVSDSKIGYYERLRRKSLRLASSEED